MSTTTGSPPLSMSRAPISFKSSETPRTRAEGLSRRESDHSFTSRVPVIENDDDEPQDAPEGRRHTLLEDEGAQSSQTPPSPQDPGFNDRHDTETPPERGERHGSMPAPPPGALNRTDLRGPLPAFRILGHPEFQESPQMPEPLFAPSHLRPPGLFYGDSGSNRSSRGTEGTEDEERMWEENQALYRQIQSRLGIEDSTPSERSSSAPTPVLEIPGSFPSSFRYGAAEAGAEPSEDEGEEPAAFHVRPLRPFPEPMHAPSTSGTRQSSSMSHPIPARSAPSTDSFFTTRSDSVYLTPHSYDGESVEGERQGAEVGESDHDDEEDYTQKFSHPLIPEPALTPPLFPLNQSSIPEPTTPKAAGMSKPDTRPSMPGPSTPSGHPWSPSMPEPQPKASLPEPVVSPPMPQPHSGSRPSVPHPVASPPMPKPDFKPPVFSAPPSQPVPHPHQPQPHPQHTASTPVSMPTKPAGAQTHTSPDSTSHNQPAHSSSYAQASSKPSAPSAPSAPSNASQFGQQKPQRPQQQHPAHNNLSASASQGKPPSNGGSSSAGWKPPASVVGGPAKPSGALSPPIHDDVKPAKPAASSTVSHNGATLVHPSPSASHSTMKPPGKPSPSISETKPSKFSPANSSSAPQAQHEQQPTASSSGKNNQHTRYVNMLLALDDIPNYWNLLASFFTWILLAGFLLFPGTFNSWREEQAEAAGAGGVSEQVKGAVLDVVSHVPL